MAGVNRAIRTRYKDILFRSKLEADWAISLDGFGIEWEYEPEGRYWGDVYYLPDFWLPQSQQWFEVKGEVLPQDLVKWVALEKHWLREPAPEVQALLAPVLGHDLALDVVQGRSPIDVPPLVLGRPKGMVELPSLRYMLAAMPDFDDDGLPNWPTEWRDAVLLSGIGFLGYPAYPWVELPEAFTKQDGLWLAFNGFPYRGGVPKTGAA